jgi:hypothetical protein
MKEPDRRPKAGISEHEEWLKLREFDVFKNILNEEWAYSDFDCWLGARDKDHYDKGFKAALNALKQFQKINGIT